MVEKAAGRGDNDLRAVAQGADLWLKADTAVDRRRANGPFGAVSADAFLDLQRELASRREHEAADRQTRRPSPTLAAWQIAHRGPAGVEKLENREHEGGRLARTGLGAGQQVAAGEHDRDRLRLNRRRLGVVLSGHGTQEIGRQPELVEGGRRLRRMVWRSHLRGLAGLGRRIGRCRRCPARDRRGLGRRRALGHRPEAIGRHESKAPDGPPAFFSGTGQGEKWIEIGRRVTGAQTGAPIRSRRY